MDILEDQYMFSVLEAEIEDCEISLVRNIKRLANLVILKNDARMILKTPSCSWLWLQGRALQVLCCVV